MSKAEKLYGAITQIKDDFVREADSFKVKRRKKWPQWTAAAAALVILAGGIYGVSRLGGNETQAGGGNDGDTLFMRYEGPVLPMTLWEENKDITAERCITFDFLPDGSRRGEPGTTWNAGVTDAYTLTNAGQEDARVTVVYPFAGSFHDLEELPALTAAGEKLETELHDGAYSGTFRGSGWEEGELNLSDIGCWEEYEGLLADGSYMEEAFSAYPQLLQPVTVYTFTDITDGGSDGVAPTLNVDIEMDYGKTTLLTYGFNGGSYDPASGRAQRDFFIPSSHRADYGRPKYLIALGEDIKGYTLQGYSDGSCEAGKEIEGAGATVTRRETTLGEVLREACRLYYDGYDTKGIANIDFETFYGAVCRFFARYGTGGTEAKERYDFGMLEDIIHEGYTNRRVLYLTAEVVIPAGKSVEVTASFVKPPSFDFEGTGKERLLGFDMMTRLGSNLTFTAQRAAVANGEYVRIAGQNFGFDLANGVTEVALDVTVPHYYLEVIPVKAED